MSWLLKMTIAVVLVLAGLSGIGVLLSGQGLDRAEKWVSIGGVVMSAAVGVGGLALGWLSWRRSPGSADQPLVTAASGAGAVAVGGDVWGAVGTEVSGPAPDPSGSAASGTTTGVHATGAGSVAIGGNSTAPIRTKVTLDDDK